MNNSLPCGLAFVKVMSEKHPDRPKRSEEENDTPGTESPNAIRYVRTRHVLKTATLHHFLVGEDCDIATLHHSQLVKTATLRHCIIPSWWKLRHCIIASFPSWWRLRHCIIASFPVGENCDIASLHHSQLVNCSKPYTIMFRYYTQLNSKVQATKNRTPGKHSLTKTLFFDSLACWVVTQARLIKSRW